MQPEFIISYAENAAYFADNTAKKDTDRQPTTRSGNRVRFLSVGYFDIRYVEVVTSFSQKKYTLFHMQSSDLSYIVFHIHILLYHLTKLTQHST